MKTPRRYTESNLPNPAIQLTAEPPGFSRDLTLKGILVSTLSVAKRRELEHRLEEVRRRIAEVDLDLQRLGFDPPGTDLDAWLHLARIIEVDPSQMTAAELYAETLAWVDRTRIQEQIRQHAKHIGVDIKYNEFGSKIYQLHGPLFFASTTSFKDMFDPKHDPDDVVIDFYYTRVYDQSGLEAINSLAEKYEQYGKRLHLTHLSPECRELLDRAQDLVEVNLSEDPQYHVATDRIQKATLKKSNPPTPRPVFAEVTS